MEPATIALIGTLVGGPVAMKIVDYYLGRGDRKDTKQKELRDELRVDLANAKKAVDDCRDEMKQVEDELDKWKERYFKELESTWKPERREVERE